MKIIPVDPNLVVAVVNVRPYEREGQPVVDPVDGPLVVVGGLPELGDGARVDTIEVRVPASAVPKGWQPYTRVRFESLVGRPYLVGGNAGVSFSARAVTVVGTSTPQSAQGASPGPKSPVA